MMYSAVNGRNQRKSQMYNPMHHSYSNYCTDTLQKSDMKLDYENEIFLNNLHLIPDPLMKNLADTLITAEKPEKLEKNSLESPKMPPAVQKQPSKEDISPDSTLAGITNFFSGVFNMLSNAVFRTRSPVHYYDCFDAESHQGSPPTWQSANIDEKDKNGQTADRLSSDAFIPNGEMNNCKSTVSVCEEKLNQVKYLLSPKPPSNPIWLRKRPKKVFVEPTSVEDSYEDAFSPEDYVNLSNEPYVQYYSPSQYHTQELITSEAPKMKIETGPIEETTEIIKDMTETDTINTQVECSSLDVEKDTKIQESDKLALENITTDAADKHLLVSSCEDKVSKLKALLKERRKKPIKFEPTPEPITEQPKPTKTIPIIKPVDKHYKNPHRMLDKRQKMKMKRTIQDDVIFANEINVDLENSPSTPSTINSSSETSLGDYFDEMKGRFRSVSNTESEDTFQIVFNDSPKHTHKASDCESEDSFIVFEDDNCYTSNDVFGDSDSDSDSEVSDSGCSTMTCKLSHSLSRTVSNLTDDTLFESSDEVDCAKVEPVIEAKGLLMDDKKKSLRKDQPAKKVTFSTDPPAVKVMRVWAFAAQEARQGGYWERFALDRDRFKRRIADVDMALSWVLKPQHRARVLFQRFMPWRNQQRRKELAEKKAEKERELKEEEERKAEKILEEKSSDSVDSENLNNEVDEPSATDEATTTTDLNGKKDENSDSGSVGNGNSESGSVSKGNENSESGSAVKGNENSDLGSVSETVGVANVKGNLSRDAVEKNKNKIVWSGKNSYVTDLKSTAVKGASIKYPKLVNKKSSKNKIGT